jgi:hypothetical protein
MTMSSYHDDFPSKYLKASDIKEPYDVTISEVVIENVGASDKPEPKIVVYFKEEGRKPAVVNRTRAEAIEDVTGTDEKTRWVGARIHISKGMTRYGGNRVECIVFGPPGGPAPKRAPRRSDPQPEPDDPMPAAAASGEEPF